MPFAPGTTIRMCSNFRVLNRSEQNDINFKKSLKIVERKKNENLCVNKKVSENDKKTILNKIKEKRSKHNKKKISWVFAQRNLKIQGT